MRIFLTTYTLANGHLGQLHTVASSSSGAIVIAMDLFGSAIRYCSARPA